MSFLMLLHFQSIQMLLDVNTLSTFNVNKYKTSHLNCWRLFIEMHPSQHLRISQLTHPRCFTLWYFDCWGGFHHWRNGSSCVGHADAIGETSCWYAEWCKNLMVNIIKFITSSGGSILQSGLFQGIKPTGQTDIGKLVICAGYQERMYLEWDGYGNMSILAKPTNDC